MESVGFKEWALVCEALGRGQQSILLRKGGIAEGRAGFQFQHREFFLFPTFFHEQLGKVRTNAAEIPPQRSGDIEIKFFAKLEESLLVTSWEMAAALEPFHILHNDVVRERFAYDETLGIYVGFVRVFRLTTPWIIPDLPAYGGCRSWVKLPELPGDIALKAVLADDEHAEQLEKLQLALGKGRAFS